MISIKISQFEFYNVAKFLEKYIKENTICRVNESNNPDITISIHKIPLEKDSSSKYTFIEASNEMMILLCDDIVDESFLKKICNIIFDHYHIDSLDFDIPFKDVNIVTDIEDKLSANYDKTDTAYFKDKDEPTIELHTARRAKGSLYYYTRRTFNDIESEKYSGSSLIKAVSICNKYTGTSVFNEEGKLIYKSTRNKITPTQNLSERVTKYAVINTPTGTGIYVSDGVKRFHVPNGTEVLITKIHNTKTEIIVTIAGKKLKSEVSSSCLL